MKTMDIKSGYHDKLAMRRHRAFVINVFLIIIFALLLLSLLFYYFFISQYLMITDINIKPTHTMNNMEVQAAISGYLDDTIVGLKLRRNILILDTSDLAVSLKHTFPTIRELSIVKRYRHSLFISITERNAIGIWCFPDRCVYFDNEMYSWGTPNESSGYLLLAIKDEQGSEIQKPYFDAITSVSQNIPRNIVIKKVVIPMNASDDLNIYTNEGYYIKISLDSDIPKQLKILGLFLGQNEISPRYYDLRVDGRIYYAI